MAIQLLVLMLVFTLLEDCWPSSRAHKWWRRPLVVDLCSWAIHPLSVAAGIALAVAGTDILLAQLPPGGASDMLWALRTRVIAMPSWLQVVTVVVIADFLAYWIHRAYHHFPALWSFHVVHHTSEELDWLSTSRLHPVSQAVDSTVVAGLLLLAGFPVATIITANVFIGAAALLAHANVRWNFGPLQHLFVSPLFHQWHHVRSDETHHHDDANFGAVFSVWDRLFGTWSLPSPNRPARFGVQDAPPLTVAGLAVHPVRVCARLLLGGPHSPSVPPRSPVEAGVRIDRADGPKDSY